MVIWERILEGGGGGRGTMYDLDTKGLIQAR
jgi:hypothetical protein